MRPVTGQQRPAGTWVKEHISTCHTHTAAAERPLVKHTPPGKSHFPVHIETQQTSGDPAFLLHEPLTFP